MLKISNTSVYGLEDSMIASGYAKLADLDSAYLEEETLRWDSMESSPHFKRMKKLGSSPTNSGHGNALKGIIVQFDVTYPVYWSPQFQRYNFIDIISSQSSMHCLSKMNVNKMFNEYVDKNIIKTIKKLQSNYNANPTYENFMKLLSNCPQGQMKTMRVSTSYLQLKTIYEQRKTHKLKEDWGEFCNWILQLPYFKELTGI